MKYLVTGGLGFVGHRLVTRLIEDGHEVRILDNLSASAVRPEHFTGKDLDIVIGDVVDPAICEEATRTIDVVVHLAAQTGVGPSVEDPVNDLRVNTFGTLNLLEGCQKNYVKRFVLASSNAVFGEQNPPMHEELATRPRSPYGVSKLAAENYCRLYNEIYGIQTVALRFSNVYGPGSISKASVVAKFFKKILKGEAIQIYGDGSQTRDFVYVEDIVSAICAAASSEQGGQVFTIGSGKETSVQRLVDEIRRTLASAPNAAAGFGIQHLPSRQGDVHQNYSCIEKAERDLGFTPQVTLEMGLEATWEWFQSQNGSLVETLSETAG